VTQSLVDLLHSDAPLVVIEAAAGCGKTRTAAKFAKEMSSRLDHQRVLLLSHTHGACGEFIGVAPVPVCGSTWRPATASP
jgi:hypothetical protein